MQDARRSYAHKSRDKNAASSSAVDKDASKTHVSHLSDHEKKMIDAFSISVTNEVLKSVETGEKLEAPERVNKVRKTLVFEPEFSRNEDSAVTIEEGKIGTKMMDEKVAVVSSGDDPLGENIEANQMVNQVKLHELINLDVIMEETKVLEEVDNENIVDGDQENAIDVATTDQHEEADGEVAEDAEEEQVNLGGKKKLVKTNGVFKGVSSKKRLA